MFNLFKVQIMKKGRSSVLFFVCGEVLFTGFDVEGNRDGEEDEVG